ncbi:luciferase domain-containing protein [Kitasatospora sp. McL0602]|uniref:luciferase domain-containing protein n=1 Tax=Kitasatospora sp. McL0602 TaxID=3439530 RepID=UPI003F89C633
MNDAEYALEQLLSWPDLQPAPPSCGIGQALVAGSSEIVHIYSSQSADVNLTASVIRRLGEELEHSPGVRLQDGSPWGTVRLGSASDARLLLTLTSLALHAHGQRGGDPAPAAPCSAASGRTPPAE